MTFSEHKKNSCQHKCIHVQASICHNRASKIFENRSRNIVFMAKIILNRVFARARETI